jgi:hypothetical protein
MKIAELFVDIIVKGGGKTAEALGSMQKGLMGLKDTSLETKAAVVGAVYALERWTAQSAQFGNSTKNLSALTGLSTTTIQQWGEYMRRSGGDAEDAASSLQAAQNILTQIKRGEGVPMGVSAISRDTHTNLLEHLDDATYVAEKVRQYIRTTHDSVGIANANALSLGITPGAIASFRRNGEDITKITSNISSEGQINRLSEVYQHWSNIWQAMAKLRDTLTASWGLPILREMDKAIISARTLVGWLEKIGSLGSWEQRGHALAEGILGKPTDIISAAKGKEGPESDASKKFREFLYGIFGAPAGANPTGAAGSAPAGPVSRSNVVPFAPKRPADSGTEKGKRHASNVNINVQQNGVEDTHDSVDAFKNEIGRAWASISTLGTVT